jgi:hypothetical protein
MEVQADLGINLGPYLKNKKGGKKVQGRKNVAQVVEHLPSNYKALSLNPSATGKTKSLNFIF